MRHSVYGCRQSLISGNILVIIEKIIEKDTLDCCTGGNQLMISHDMQRKLTLVVLAVNRLLFRSV